MKNLFRNPITSLLFGLAIALIFLFFASCITEKKRKEICNTCTSQSTKKDSVVYRIDTLNVMIPGENGPTIYLDNPCKELCDSLGRLRNVSLITKRGNQVIKINTQGNGLNIFGSTLDTSVKATVGVKETFSTDRKTDIKWIDCKKEHRNTFDGFCRWFFYIVGPIMAGLIGFKIYKLKTGK